MFRGRLHNLYSRFSGHPDGSLPTAVARRRNGRGASTPRPAVGVRQACLSLAAALCLAILSPTPAFSLTQGDQIVNTAQFTASGITATASVTVTAVVPTPSTIDFLTYAPGATAYNVATGACRTGSDPTAS